MPTAAEILAEMDRRHAEQDAALAAAQRPSGQSDEIARRRAELLAQMEAGDAQHRERLATGHYRGAIPGPQAAPGALPPPGPTAGTPGPQMAATGAPSAITLPSGEPRPDVMSYILETARNVPSDAARVGQSAWEGVRAAAADPLGALQGLGEGALGNMQAASIDPRRQVDPRHDFRPPPERWGQYDLHNIGETLRERPVQTALDALGLAAVAPGAGSAVRGAVSLARPQRIPVPGEAPPRGPRMAPEDVRVATEAGDAVRETVGKAKGAASEAAKRERGIREFIANAPTTEAMHRQASAFFEAAKNAGVRFSSREFGPFRKKMVRELREQGADKVLHPKVDRLLTMIENAPPGVAPSMANILTLRRQFGAAASDMDRSTSRLGAMGVDLIDDFVEAGSKETGGMMRDANRIWAQMRKTEQIQRAIAKADTAQQGLEAGLRAEFKTIYRGIVDKNRKYRGFTKDETAAIKAVAQGNLTSNVLRRIASLSGGSGPQRAMQNLLQGGAVGGGLGYALGGPAGAALGAAVAPVAGQMAGRMATRGTQRRANLARAIAARGMTPKEARRTPQDASLAEIMSGFMETSP